ALALARRSRRSPLEDPGIDQQDIDDALEPPPNDDHQGPPPRSDGRADNDPSATPKAPTRIIRLETARDTGDASGRRSMVEGPRGRLVGDRPVPEDGGVRSVAVGATVRAAVARRADDPDGPLVDRADVRDAVREQ